jgi:hypothetical protein
VKRSSTHAARSTEGDAWTRLVVLDVALGAAWLRVELALARPSVKESEAPSLLA